MYGRGDCLVFPPQLFAASAKVENCRQPGEVENVTYATGQLGEKVTAADYIRATQTAHRLGRQMAAFHETYDVLLTPALATLPPKLGWIDMMMDDGP